MSKIQKFLERCASVEEGVFPGASWVIGNSNSILESGSCGFLARGLDRVTSGSIYDIASLTKIFVSIALMKQLEDGLIRLQDTVSYFLPFFKACPIGECTILDLMTHTNPFSAASPSLYRKVSTYSSTFNRENIFGAMLSHEFRQDFREKVVYTCEAYIVLGEILKEIDKTGLDNIVKNRVLDPLDMKETCYLPNADLLKKIAPTEFSPLRGGLVHGIVHDENALIMGGISGNAGIFSSSLDTAKLAQAMLISLNENNESGFLNKNTAQIMTRCYTKGMGQNRGLGFQLAGEGTCAGDLFSPCSFGHTGFTGTSIWIDPRKNLFAVLFSNRVNPSRDNLGILRARHIFHNLAVLEYFTHDITKE